LVHARTKIWPALKYFVEHSNLQTLSIGMVSWDDEPAEYFFGEAGKDLNQAFNLVHQKTLEESDLFGPLDDSETKYYRMAWEGAKGRRLTWDPAFEF